MLLYFIKDTANDAYCSSARGAGKFEELQHSLIFRTLDEAEVALASMQEKLSAQGYMTLMGKPCYFNDDVAEYAKGEVRYCKKPVLEVQLGEVVFNAT